MLDDDSGGERPALVSVRSWLTPQLAVLIGTVRPSASCFDLKSQGFWSGPSQGSEPDEITSGLVLRASSCTSRVVRVIRSTSEHQPAPADSPSRR
jgi:hypothetical protein